MHINGVGFNQKIVTTQFYQSEFALQNGKCNSEYATDNCTDKSNEDTSTQNIFLINFLSLPIVLKMAISFSFSKINMAKQPTILKGGNK